MHIFAGNDYEKRESAKLLRQKPHFIASASRGPYANDLAGPPSLRSPAIAVSFRRGALKLRHETRGLGVPTMHRIGDLRLTRGESLRWDERRQRLYFVDIAAETLHWLDDAEPPLQSFKLPSRPTGLVLTGDNRLIVCLADPDLRVLSPALLWPSRWV
jgi:hypothetical protein